MTYITNMTLIYLSKYFPNDILSIIDVYMMFLNFEEVIMYSEKIHNKKEINEYLKYKCQMDDDMMFQYDLKIHDIVKKSMLRYDNRIIDKQQYHTYEKVTEIIKYLNYFIIFKYSDSNLNMICIPNDILNFLNDTTVIVHMYDFDINKYI
jgi:hypothetical protein